MTTARDIADSSKLYWKMARLGHVLSIGWRLRPAPTAVGGGRSRAAAAAAAADDDEVQEISEETFKRRTLRLVRTGVGGRTVGGRVGLFAYGEIAKCRFVGFYYGNWLSEPDYLALLEREAQESRPRPYGKYALRSSPMKVAGRTWSASQRLRRMKPRPTLTAAPSSF